MPLFFLIFVVLAIYVSTLPNAIEGYKYLFIPDWSYFFKPMTWVAAMGQAFFSLTITGSILIIYGSYLKKDIDIQKIAVTTALLDTVAAIVSSFVIIPAVFAFGINPQAGPTLMFVTMPRIFGEMIASGNVFVGRGIAFFFFTAVLFAGITSLISLFEVLCGTVEQKAKISRKKASAIVCFVVLAIGIFFEGNDAFGFITNIALNYWLPICALIGGFTVYYILPKEDVKNEMMLGRTKPLSKIYLPTAKYFYVPLAFIVVVLSFCIEGGIG